MMKHCLRKSFAQSDIFSGIVGVFNLPSYFETKLLKKSIKFN